MNKIKVNFENCYGIKRLVHEFDFTSKNVVAIYAPNGMMKSSFAKTFKDVCDKVETKDRIYTNRITVRNITNENSVSLASEEIFVIEPYNEEYKSNKISTLLVNKELRKEYEAIYTEINQKKQDLLKNLKKLSGLKKEEDIEITISQDIPGQGDFFKSLRRIKEDVNEYQNNNGFENILYSNVFNDNSEKLLQDKNIMNNLSEYIATYDKLLDSSKFFKKGVFTHNNASDIAKQLKTNGWFEANHSVNIKIDNKNGTFEERKISTEAELEAAINQEKEAIINNEDLRKTFDKLNDALKKNEGSRSFRDYIEQNKDILPELQNPGKFKDKLWIAYLSQYKTEYENLLSLYETSKEKIQNIVNAAENERTKWQDVINKFNERYSVPFKLRMSNQPDVILQDKVPAIKFDFIDGSDIAPIEEQDLIQVLSQGEKRALYILNIIFEVEARKAASQNTLFIIDDIADSFDYKNKYAIIEYLKDISDIKVFKIIILTHNFDFFRSILSRLELIGGYYATKYTNEIKLETPTYSYKNPFDVWKRFQKPKHEIALIPFVRVLAEFCGKNEVFNYLTALLHQKTDTNTITMKNLSDKFFEIIGLSLESNVGFNPTKLVIEYIYEFADDIKIDTDEKMELEDKVILSIAIRMKAEEFMINKINYDVSIGNITKNQTRKLYDEFKKLFSNELETLSTMDKVNLMTPENIHINSFMYEPILDMSNEHLKKLYKDVSDLLTSTP